MSELLATTACFDEDDTEGLELRMIRFLTALL
jgi:hypothetical protein